MTPVCTTGPGLGCQQPLSSSGGRIPQDDYDPLESKYRQLVTMRRREAKELQRLKTAHWVQGDHEDSADQRSQPHRDNNWKVKGDPTHPKMGLRSHRRFTNPKTGRSGSFTTESCPNLKLKCTYQREMDGRRKVHKMASRCPVRTNTGDSLDRILLFLLKRTARALHDALTLIHKSSRSASQAFERSASQLVRIADVASSPRDQKPADLRLTPSEGELMRARGEPSWGSYGDAKRTSDRWARNFRRHLSASKMRRANVENMLKVLAWDVARFHSTWCNPINKSPPRT